ncbi:MAG: hypothetical protein QM692_23370, partial [Thermomicrobiales bacterium]
MGLSRLLLLALVFALALPFALLEQHSPSVITSAAPVAAAPASPGTTPEARALAAKQDRKAKRRAERKSQRQRNPDRRTQARSVNAEGAGTTECGPGLIPLGETGRCTHGPDPAPPGIAQEVRRTVLDAQAVGRETPNITCNPLDGESGYRVQVIYAYDTAGASDYIAQLSTVRAAAAGADDLLRESSLAAGQEMNFLFVTDATCDIVVDNVGFSTAQMQDFGAMVLALHGNPYYSRTNRLYLIFADTTSAGICGVGTLWPDDSDAASNANNIGPSYSRADRNCWAPRVAAHELMHNLGGVQYSAPHTSGGGHCIDEWDVMCYSDAPYYPAMQIRCADQATYQYRYDCNYDDYFNPSPPTCSYLDTHWNTADNIFLTQGLENSWANPSVCPTIALTSSRASVKSKKRLQLTANLANAPAGASVAFQVCRGGSCPWGSGQQIGSADASAPTVSWKATGKGQVTFVAQVSSGGITATSDQVTVQVKKV